jgi:hypothetical protein
MPRFGIAFPQPPQPLLQIAQLAQPQQPIEHHAGGADLDRPQCLLSMPHARQRTYRPAPSSLSLLVLTPPIVSLNQTTCVSSEALEFLRLSAIMAPTTERTRVR